MKQHNQGIEKILREFTPNTKEIALDKTVIILITVAFLNFFATSLYANYKISTTVENSEFELKKKISYLIEKNKTLENKNSNLSDEFSNKSKFEELRRSLARHDKS